MIGFLVAFIGMILLNVLGWWEYRKIKRNKYLVRTTPITNKKESPTIIPNPQQNENDRSY